MKKAFITIIFITIMALLLSGCGASKAESGGEGLEIIATVFPAYDFARHIAGDRASVTLLVPPGSETHSFEPTAQDIIRIQSGLLICNGGESEAWVEEMIAGGDLAISPLYMMDCVETLEEEVREGMQTTGYVHEHEAEDEDEHEHEEEFDEHVWTSPVNAALICTAICEKLSELDPENADYFRANCSEYCEALYALDEAFREAAENAAYKTLIFADRFPVRYFVEEYGFDYYAAFPGCADDAEPSARTVAFLIDKVREEKVPAVFYIEFSNEKMADVICEDTGCKKLLFHSCHNVTAQELEEGVGYLELMEGNLLNLKEALG